MIFFLLIVITLLVISLLRYVHQSAVLTVLCTADVAASAFGNK